MVVGSFCHASHIDMTNLRALKLVPTVFFPRNTQKSRVISSARIDMGRFKDDDDDEDDDDKDDNTQLHLHVDKGNNSIGFVLWSNCGLCCGGDSSGDSGDSGGGGGGGTRGTAVRRVGVTCRQDCLNPGVLPPGGKNAGIQAVLADACEFLIQADWQHGVFAPIVASLFFFVGFSSLFFLFVSFSGGLSIGCWVLLLRSAGWLLGEFWTVGSCDIECKTEVSHCGRNNFWYREPILILIVAFASLHCFLQVYRDVFFVEVAPLLSKRLSKMEFQ
jgi:hypothetical protein